MPKKPNWLWFVVGHALIYGFVGFLLGVVAGGVLIGFSGGSIGAILDRFSGSPTFSFGNEIRNAGTMIGLVFGGTGGGVVGAIVFGVLGVITPPRRSHLPPRVVVVRTLIGMTLGTLAAMSTFYLVCGLFTLAQRTAFIDAIWTGTTVVLFGAPILMSAGLIYGAVNGYNLFRQQWQFQQNQKLAEEESAASALPLREV